MSVKEDNQLDLEALVFVSRECEVALQFVGLQGSVVTKRPESVEHQWWI